ncbi:SufE family protein [Skermanella mucosa]|uniref:SufE family protein n=1 Tax=Skermanella mucosa TaxID=1789672 RepID=UPI00192B9BDB|nr:SufE family protein [Skermanella mucosa]UEM23394.1 SufE family protein [Skermanella mucosa]
MTIDELIENFELFDEWEDRYRYVIDLGRGLPPLDDRYHTDAFKVEGCMSQVWLVPLPSEERRMRFAADSDSAIVKGLAAVLLTAYSDHTPEEILDTDLEAIFARIGLDQHLSPNRRNGFFSMVETIKASAKARIAASD